LFFFSSEANFFLLQLPPKLGQLTPAKTENVSSSPSKSEERREEYAKMLQQYQATPMPYQKGKFSFTTTANCWEERK
jgi:hypothetical protein